MVTFLTRPTSTKTLSKFYNEVTPYGNGWRQFKKIAKDEGIELKTTNDVFTIDLASMLLGIVFVYTSLFATGYFIYGNTTSGGILTAIALVSAIVIFTLWKKK